MVTDIDELLSALKSVPPPRLALLAPFLVEAVERFTAAADEVHLADIDRADLIRLFFAVELRVGHASTERTVSRGRFYEARPR